MCTPVQMKKLFELFEFALNVLSDSTKVTVDKWFVPFKIVQREVNTQNGWQKDSRRMGSQKDIFKRNFYTTKKSNYLRIMFPLAFRSQSFNSTQVSVQTHFKVSFFSGRNKLSLSNFLLGILLHLEVFRNRVEQVCRVSGSEKLAYRDSRYVSESRCCELNILFKKSEMREACC